MCKMRNEYEIQIEVENNCYLDCLHCSSLLMRHEPSNPFIAEELMSFLKLFDVPMHVYFTGGEPLANPNLNRLIELVKRVAANSKVGIFTCGILQNNTSVDRDLAMNLKMIGLDDCYISLYHCDAEKHDLITNRKGSYCTTKQSIRNFIDVDIDVKVHLVINRFNYQELDKTIFSILNLGVSQVRLLRLVKTGAAEMNWGKIGVPYKKQNEAIKDIISKLERYSEAVTISGFPTEIACRPTQQAVKCQAGTHLLYVTNSKEIYPCACTKNNPSFLIGSICDLTKSVQYLKKQQEYQFNEDCLNPMC